MKYEFHVGDYVKTRAGYIGYIDGVNDLENDNIAVRICYSDGDIGYFRVDDLNIANNFLRIGAYDFTKKEKKKIEQLEKDLPLEMKVGDKVATMKQYFDGNYNTIIYSTKMINKINELVDAVNKLMDKEDEK